MGLGRWVPGHRGWFLAGALGLISLALHAALREKRRTGKNNGLVAAGLALLVIISLLAYDLVRPGP